MKKIDIYYVEKITGLTDAIAFLEHTTQKRHSQMEDRLRAITMATNWTLVDILQKLEEGYTIAHIIKEIAPEKFAGMLLGRTQDETLKEKFNERQ